MLQSRVWLHRADPNRQFAPCTAVLGCTGALPNAWPGPEEVCAFSSEASPTSRPRPAPPAPEGSGFYGSSQQLAEPGTLQRPARADSCAMAAQGLGDAAP